MVSPSIVEPNANIISLIPPFSILSIKLDIFNAKGVHIYRLFEGDKRAGIYTLSWDGKNNNGQEVSSGVYIILLQENNMQYNQRHYTETRKVILVK